MAAASILHPQWQIKIALRISLVLILMGYTKGHTEDLYQEEHLEVTFKPDFFNEQYYFGRAKSSIKFKFDVNESLPNMINNFSLCFKINLEYLSPQPIFTSQELSFYLFNPIKNYGFIVLNRTNRYLFKFNRIRQFIWHSFCILLWNNGRDSILQVYHNQYKRFEKVLDNTIHSFKRNFVEDLLFGVFDHTNEPKKIQNALYQGKLTMLFASTQLLSLYQIQIFAWAHLMTDFTPNLFLLCKSNMSTDYKTITTQKIERKDLMLEDKTMTFFVKKKMSLSNAVALCQKLNDFVQTLPTGKRGDFLVWISHMKIKSNKIEWAYGEPNGKERENCVAFHGKTRRYYDLECNRKLQFFCPTTRGITFTLRGLSESRFEIDRRYILKIVQISKEEDEFIFVGLYDNSIVKKNSRWIIITYFDHYKVYGFYNGSNYFPVGLNYWYISSKGCMEIPRRNCYEEKMLLMLTKCRFSEFTCNSGKCISMKKRCNFYIDCDDESDEESCDHFEIKNYRKEFPPSSKNQIEALPIHLSIYINSISSVKELENKCTWNINVKMTWQDQRIQFINVGKEGRSMTEKEKSLLWIPLVRIENSADGTDYLILDKFCDISIVEKVCKVPSRSPISSLINGIITNGSQVDITYSRTFELSLYCSFYLKFYPFDTQLCSLKLVIPFSMSQKTRLLIGNHFSSNIIAPNIKLLQFYIFEQSIELLHNNTQYNVNIVLKRIFTNIITTTYIPTFGLQIIALLTLFISEERVDTILMSTLTTMLVMYTIYQNVTVSLPQTSFNKMIDYWLIFCLVQPFLVFVVEVLNEIMTSRNRKEESNVSKHNTFKVISQTLLILLTIVFDILYFVYNMSIHYYVQSSSKSL